MKFIHTADWHLGKLVHGIYMTEDQRFALQQFINIVEEEKPDAVVIAGDLYDRAVPPTEAVELLNDVLFQINVELKIPVIAIAGNHDSSERLSFGSSWYKKSQFYLEGKLSKDCHPVVVNGVNFYLIPYAEPGTVRQLLENESIHTHEDAMRAIVHEIEKTLDPNVPNVFVGHAFVSGGKTTDSERSLSVGGSGVVPMDVFAPFTYTALGHLHSPDAIHHTSIKYSGSLLKYSFSESQQRKSILVVDIDQNGNISTRERFIQPKRDVREIEGYLEEILDPSFYQNQNIEDYLKVTLLDEGALIDPIAKLRQVYPNILHLERKMDLIDSKEKTIIHGINESKKSELELFEMFYQEMTTSEFTDKKKEIMMATIDKVRKEDNN